MVCPRQTGPVATALRGYWPRVWLKLSGSASGKIDLRVVGKACDLCHCSRCLRGAGTTAAFAIAWRAHQEQHQIPNIEAARRQNVIWSDGRIHYSHVDLVVLGKVNVKLVSGKL